MEIEGKAARDKSGNLHFFPARNGEPYRDKTKHNSFIAHEPMKDDQGNYTGDYDVTIALKSKGVKKRTRGDKLGDKLRDLATKVYSETIARDRMFSDDDNIQDILSYTRRTAID